MHERLPSRRPTFFGISATTTHLSALYSCDEKIKRKIYKKYKIEFGATLGLPGGRSQNYSGPRLRRRGRRAPGPKGWQVGDMCLRASTPVCPRVGLGATNDRARSAAWWFPALCHLVVAGGGGIFAAASFAATGDAGAEFVDESSPQPVIAPTKTNNAKTRSARCMREPPPRVCC